MYILSGIQSSKILWGFLWNDCVQELWRETQAKASYSGLPAISLMYSEGSFSAAKHQRLLREGMRTAPVKAVAEAVYSA